VVVPPGRAKPSDDPMPSASRAPSCGKESYLSGLSNCGVAVILQSLLDIPGSRRISTSLGRMKGFYVGKVLTANFKGFSPNVTVANSAPGHYSRY
jgi:hypothetical protein